MDLRLREESLEVLDAFVHEHFKATFLVQVSGFKDLMSEQVGFHIVTY